MPTPKLAKQAAGYVRVSTTKQATEGLSLDAQENAIRARAERESWQLTEIFKDEGISGKNDARPELLRLFASLDDLDYLIIPRLDRLGRRTITLQENYERLEKAGVGLICLNPEFDSSKTDGRLMRDLLSALASYESELTGERVRAVMSSRTTEKGLHHGKAPFGFEKPNKRLVAVEPQAAIVRRIWQEVGGGLAQKAICAKLDSDGIAPPGTAKRWTPSTISRMVRNVVYGGKLEINGEVFDGEHEAIVDADLFEKVQALVKANSDATSKGKGRTPAAHLFIRGHLRCAVCNGPMLPRTDARSGRDFYMCLTRRDEGNDACSMLNVPRLPVDQAVFDYFSDVGIDLEATRERLLSSITGKRNETKQLLRAAQKAERDADAAIERVKDDYTSGAINAAEWKELRDDLRTKQREASERAQALEDELANTDGEGAAVKGAENAALARLAEVRAAVSGEVDNQTDVEAARAGLRRMFEAFYIAPAGDVDRAELASIEGPPSLSMDAQLAELLRINKGSGVTVEDVEAAQAAELDDTDDIEAGDWIIFPEPRLELVEDLEIAYRPVLNLEAMPGKAEATYGATPVSTGQTMVRGARSPSESGCAA